jgi:hypothetical protein
MYTSLVASDNFDGAVLVSLSIAAAYSSCLLPFVNAALCFNGTKELNLTNKLVQMGGSILPHVPLAFSLCILKEMTLFLEIIGVNLSAWLVALDCRNGHWFGGCELWCPLVWNSYAY